MRTGPVNPYLVVCNYPWGMNMVAAISPLERQIAAQPNHVLALVHESAFGSRVSISLRPPDSGRFQPHTQYTPPLR